MHSKCTPINLFKNNNYKSNLTILQQESNRYKFISDNLYLQKVIPFV